MIMYFPISSTSPRSSIPPYHPNFLFISLSQKKVKTKRKKTNNRKIPQQNKTKSLQSSVSSFGVGQLFLGMGLPWNLFIYTYHVGQLVF